METTLNKNEWIHCDDHKCYIVKYDGIKSVNEAQRHGHYKCMLGIKERAGSNK